MVPSLQSICGVPVVVVFSNHPDVKKQIFSTFKYKPNYDYYEELLWEDAINKEASKILEDYNPVLKSIFPRLQIKLIGLEMLKLANYLQARFGLSLEFSQNFIKSSLFTSRGIIDENKTARELVEEQSLSLLLRYKIACHFCLQDIVPNLWPRLGKNELNFKKIPRRLFSETPIVMWSNYLEEIKSDVQNQPKITRKFKAVVFSYAIKYKNVAALKFSLDPEGALKKSKDFEKGQKKVIHKSFANCLKWIKNFVGELGGQFLPANYVARYNLLEYYISTMKKQDVIKLLCKYNYSALKCFLRWPYQYQFMNIAQTVFESMDKRDYLSLILEIISLIHREKSYNYCLLLREVWTKSPSRLKKYVIDYESGEYDSIPHESLPDSFLIEDYFTMGETTSDDMQNLYLILKDASPVSKEKIFRIQGKAVCGDLCSVGNYERANFFFKVLDLNEDAVKAFKNKFAFDFFFPIICSQRIECVNDEFFKWVLGTDEIDELKDRIFYTLTHADKIENLFTYFPGENRFSFADKILKYFLKSDDKIEEWKENILLNVDTIYSPIIYYYDSGWLDNLLMYLGTSDDKRSNIKGDLLLRNLPKIAKSLYEEENFFEGNIIFLCLCEEERIRNFMKKLRAFYNDSIKQKMCLLCMNNNLVTSNGDGARLQCEYHGTNGFISPNDVNEICSSFSMRMNDDGL